MSAASTTAWVDPLFNAVQSHALSSAWFETVNTHEPKSAPTVNGLSAALWIDYIGPTQLSGLNSISALVVLDLRVFSSMLQQPEDAIDPNIARAVSSLMGDFNDDFDFDGLIRNVDLLGMSGRRLEAKSGYIKQDTKLFRVMTLSIPCLINDVWPIGSGS